jgi:hypothetical protein
MRQHIQPFSLPDRGGVLHAHEVYAAGKRRRGAIGRPEEIPGRRRKLHFAQGEGGTGRLPLCIAQAERPVLSVELEGEAVRARWCVGGDG